MEPPYPLIDVPAGPLDLHADVANTFWIDMAVTHNVFLRALNNVYEIAPKIKPEDEAAFAGYCMTGVDVIHIHHKGEEDILFRHLSKHLDMSENIREHEEFQKGIDEFQKFFKAVLNREEKYDGEKVRTLLRGFGDLLAKHLHDEIPTIRPNQMNKLGKSELDAMMKEHGIYAKKNGSLFLILPWCISHHDSLNMPSWPLLPPPLVWVARNVAGWKNSRYWKFSPYDMKGNPRQYAQ